MSGRDPILSSLLDDIRKCRICADFLPRGPRPVLQASDTARIFVCGQAPGARVHETGLPFNDPSGDRLRDWMGVDRATFYDPGRIAIVPMGFCYPGRDARGGDKPPCPQCAETWHDRLFDALPQPALKLVIGRYAQDYHLKGHTGKTLTETVRNWRDFGGAVIPLPHPSPRNIGWFKRNAWFESEVVPAVRSAVRTILDGQA
ncbi:MAG: uracil-DNA glycosylase family protein [Alphaproteobacteria bacterium]|nr:MAG: uracil-DNA glycosylase family protein [Alphaproteobacteria bacterium]